MRLREIDDLFWSSCPNSELVARLARRGVRLVVDLTEGECSYVVPAGVERLNYPIPDFSFKAFESVLADVVLPVLKRLEGGDGVLVHCRGGIGRSGAAVAMILSLRYRLPAQETVGRVKRLGFVGETPSQGLAVRWLLRLREFAEPSWVVRLVSALRAAGHSYWDLYSDHASTVAGIALDALEAVADKFGLDKRDLLNAYAAGLLHDVGRVLGPESVHHEMSAQFARGLREVAERCDVEVVARAVLHHRRRTDLLGDPVLRELGVAAQLAAAAVRLGDALYNAYEGDGTYIGVEKRGSELVLLLSSARAVEPQRLEEKSKAFAHLTGLSVRAEWSSRLPWHWANGSVGAKF